MQKLTILCCYAALANAVWSAVPAADFGVTRDDVDPDGTTRLPARIAAG